MENAMGAAISMWSLSFSTVVRFPDCTVCNKASTQKAAQAQSLNHSQILAAPELITFQQLLCLHTARESLHEKHLLSCCLISEHHQLLNTLRVFPRCFLQVSLYQTLTWLQAEGRTASVPFHLSLGAAASPAFL